MKLLKICIVLASLFALLLLCTGTVLAGKRMDSGGQAGRTPPPVGDIDFYDNGNPETAQVALGKLLFFDKILSGNQDISCATCHHPLTDTGDGLSLSVGTAGKGLGVCREATDIRERVPRNAPPIFNLGARQFTRMFHDGRVEWHPDYPSGIKTPAGVDLPEGLDNVLAAQAMFPVTSPAEMCGYTKKKSKKSKRNELAESCATGDVSGTWAALAKRLGKIPEYVELFAAAFPHEIGTQTDISFVHVANAIATFEASAWRADNSPFDRYLSGNTQVMSAAAARGKRLFYGKAKCYTCHSGTFQTDMAFHAVAMPQIGPGRGDDFDGHGDYGREQVTGNLEDRFRFRTPTLRNVALTGPWGHAGAYNSLKAMIRHMLNPVEGLLTYDQKQAVLPSHKDLGSLDFVVMNDPERVDKIASANEQTPVAIGDAGINDLLEFLYALNDPASLDLRTNVPQSVPSGLTLAD